MGTTDSSVYGLIGFPLSHSFSKRYFDNKFLNENISNTAFELFPIEDIHSFPTLIEANPNLKGVSVTIPHKKNVIQFLSEKSEAVIATGACNCIKIEQGKLSGFNTDVIGFENSFKSLLQPHHNKALVLGTGGAAVAVAFILDKLGIPFQFVSRSLSHLSNAIQYEAVNKACLEEHTIIINTTPLGTYPQIETCPSLPYHLLTPNHYLFDLVYNPAETKFLSYGKAVGATIKNGYDPVFIPNGSDKTFAEMTLEEKNIFSHRRKATESFVQFLHTSPYILKYTQNPVFIETF